MGDHQEVIENAICNLDKIQVSAQNYHDIINKAHKLLALLEDMDKTKMSKKMEEDARKKCKTLVSYAIQCADTMVFLEENDMYTMNIYVQANEILDQARNEIDKLL